MTATGSAVSCELQRTLDFVAGRVLDLDAGSADIRADLAMLGESGLLEAGLGSDSIAPIVSVIEELSTVSLAVGFCTWAQRMAIEYVYRAGPALRERHLTDLCSGRRIGVTAMAAALQQVAGLADVPIRAVAQPHGGLVVSGPIRWASNVFPDSLIILPARGGNPDEAEGPAGRPDYCVAVTADTAGVVINPPPSLMALGATASTSLNLSATPVSAEEIISTDLTGFVTAIRPTFLILQTAFCLGIAGAALDGAEKLLGGTGTQFAGQLASARAELRGLRAHTYDVAGRPGGVALPDLIRLRLSSSTAAVGATRLESTMSGGRGYMVGSPVNIRLREAGFLPIQSPSEGQLRWELTQYE